jgi:hypothetical protein
MGTTAAYGFRFPDAGDPPDGPTQIQHLAEDVEAKIAKTDNVNTLQRFTVNGTYTKPADLKAVKVRLVGGGGGGGSAAGTGAGQASAGGAGGGGGYSERIIPASLLGATTAVTVGAGGGASAAGGTSSYGAFLSGSGGGAGTGDSAHATGTADGGQGGSGTGGDVNIDGEDGDVGRTLAGEPSPARGGDSQLGYGGRQVVAVNGAGGIAGQLYGGGGGGAALRPSQSAVSGGAGAAGVVLVENIF